MGYREQFFEECRGVAGSFTGKSVLVAGGGPGLDCVPFAEAGATVTGLDICDDIGREFSHPAVRYYRASMEGCGLETGRFDVVFSIATMEHVQNIEAAYREATRLARPGGVIYVLAAPLWNSRRGHHLDCLNPFPWIHLRRTPDEIAALAEGRGITHEGRPVREILDWLFVSDYFNRSSSRRYTDACRELPVSQTPRNDLWLDGAEELTPAIRSELEARGYSEADLLATSHTLIALK
jgi:SAM-dependent methyltransferase